MITQGKWIMQRLSSTWLTFAGTIWKLLRTVGLTESMWRWGFLSNREVHYSWGKQQREFFSPRGTLMQSRCFPFPIRLTKGNHCQRWKRLRFSFFKIIFASRSSFQLYSKVRTLLLNEFNSPTVARTMERDSPGAAVQRLTLIFN